MDSITEKLYEYLGDTHTRLLKATIRFFFIEITINIGPGRL